MIMEAGKSQDLQLANWRHRRARFQLESWQALRPKNISCFSLSVKAERAIVPAQSDRQAEFPLVQERVRLFASFRLSTDWMRDTHIREGDLPYSVYHLNVSLIHKHSHGHTQKNVSQLSSHPMAHTSWHIKLTITGIYTNFPSSIIYTSPKL